MNTKASGSLAAWTTPQCPIGVEYVPQVLKEIRLTVMEAFYTLPHGGMEVGGILLGKSSATAVTITGYSPLECEHAFGPSFQLSGKDRDRLLELIATATGNGEEVVGWYHSHTRSPIFLSESDLEVYERYFGDPFQLALVMKPSSFRPLRCGFFFRDAGGVVHSEGSYLEFDLDSGSVPPELARPESGETSDGSLAEGAASDDRGPNQTAETPETPNGTDTDASPVMPARRAEAQPLPAAVAHSYYTWSFPGAPVCVWLHLEVVKALEEQLADQREKRDLTGILLGEVEATAIVVSNVELLPHASESEMQLALAEIESAGRTRAIGFYRIRGGGRLKMSEEDQTLARNLFPHPTDVFLVIHASEAGPANATFFFWDQGRLFSEFSLMDFVLDAQTLAAKELRRASAALAAPGKTRPSTVPYPAFEARRGPERMGQAAPVQPNRWRWIAAILAAVLVIAIGAFTLTRTRSVEDGQAPAAASRSSPSLGLRIRREGTDIILSWDRNAVSKLSANAGLLIIKDGSEQKELFLDAARLTTAQILLAPEHSQVDVQLTLLLPNNRTASESGIVILPAKKSDQPAILTATVPSRVVEPSEVTPESTRIRAAKTFTPPLEQAPTPSAPLIDQPPPLTVRPTPSAVEQQFLSQEADAPPALGPALGRAGQMPAALRSASTPAVPLRIGGEAERAVLISQTEPLYPVSARVARIQGIVVMEAVIGSDGHVRDVKVLRGPLLLRQAAMDAVKEWIYKPAMLNGQPVESLAQVQINFRGRW